MSAEKLEPGWYRVKWRARGNWEPVYISDWNRLLLAFSKEIPPGRIPGANMVQPALIGPRIEPPADSGEG